MRELSFAVGLQNVKTYTWRPHNFLARVMAFAVGIVVLVAVFLFSLVVFSMVLTATLIALGYVWWKIRSMRAQGKRVIDAESSREILPRDTD